MSWHAIRPQGNGRRVGSDGDAEKGSVLAGKDGGKRVFCREHKRASDMDVTRARCPECGERCKRPRRLVVPESRGVAPGRGRGRREGRKGRREALERRAGDKGPEEPCMTCGSGGQEVEFEIEVELRDDVKRALVEAGQTGVGRKGRRRGGRGAEGMESKGQNRTARGAGGAAKLAGPAGREGTERRERQMMAMLLDPLAFLLETASCAAGRGGDGGAGGLVIKADDAKIL